MAKAFVIFLGIQGLFLSIALATDQILLQDFCVSDPTSRGTMKPSTSPYLA